MKKPKRAASRRPAAAPRQGASRGQLLAVASPPPATAPDPVAQRCFRAIAKAAGVAENKVTGDTKLSDLKDATTLGIAQALNDEFNAEGLQLDPTELDAAKTAGDVVAIVKAKLAQPKKP